MQKNFGDIPIIDDIRNFDGTKFAGASLLTGGFPCQPFSCAGKRRGKEDDRFLWPEMLRIISEAKPAWIIGENVAGIINMELENCCTDLEAQGYEVQPIIIPACAVDAPHRRDRVWIIARRTDDIPHSEHERVGRRIEQQEGVGKEDVANSGCISTGSSFTGACCEPIDSKTERIRTDKGNGFADSGKNVANSDSSYVERNKCSIGIEQKQSYDCEPCWWPVESSVRRVFDELSKRLDESGLTASCLFKKEVLQHDLHGESIFKISIEPFSNPETISFIQKEVLRTMRDIKKSRNTSQRQKLDEQRGIKFNDAVFVLSHIITSFNGGYSSENNKTALHYLRKTVLQTSTVLHSSDSIEEIWESINEEDQAWKIMASMFGFFWSEWPNTPRIADKIPRRMDRLRGLGNAIVPQVAYQIMKEIVKFC